MEESFNPYVEWLGRPAGRQPSSYYELLAIDPREPDPAAIAHAADALVTQVRRVRPGARVVEWQQLLDALRAAKACLLDPAARAAYDASLIGRPTGAATAAAAPPQLKEVESRLTSAFTSAAPPPLKQVESGPTIEFTPAAPVTPQAAPPPIGLPPDSGLPAPAPLGPAAPPLLEAVFPQPSASQAAMPGFAPPILAPNAPPSAVPPGAVSATPPTFSAPPAFGTAPAASVPPAVGAPPISASTPAAKPMIFGGGSSRYDDEPAEYGSIIPSVVKAAGRLLVIGLAVLLGYLVIDKWFPDLIPGREKSARVAEGPGSGAAPDRTHNATPAMPNPTGNVPLPSPNSTTSGVSGAGLTPGLPGGNGALPGNPPAATAPPVTPATPGGGMGPPAVVVPPPVNPSAEPAPPANTDQPAGPSVPSQPPAVTPEPPAVTPEPPAVAPQPPAVNPEPAAAAAVDPALRTALDDVRQAMAGRDLARARQALAMAALNVHGPADQAQIARMETLLANLEEFWKGIAQIVDHLHSTEEFVVDNTPMIVVDATTNELTVRSEGRNLTIPVRRLPHSLVMALAARIVKAPSNQVLLGTYLAFEPGHRDQARRLWEQAGRAGQDVKDLMPELDAPAGAAPAERRPVPQDPGKLEKAEKSVTARLKNEFDQGPEVRAKQDVVARLLDAANASKDNDERFVLFWKARERALAAGKPALACQVVDRINAFYEIDSIQYKLDLLEQAAKASSGAQPNREIAQNALLVAGAAASANRLDEAERLVTMAGSAARKSSSKSLMRDAMTAGQQLRAIKIRAAKASKDAGG